MEMVGAEALAALFGVYGDVVKIKMMPEQESALIQMEKPVQVSRRKNRKSGKRVWKDIHTFIHTYVHTYIHT